jgi:hypothetical protein
MELEGALGVISSDLGSRFWLFKEQTFGWKILRAVCTDSGDL